MSEVQVVRLEAHHLDETLAMMRRWSPDHPELAERSLYEWQRCTRYLALADGRVVGHIAQVAHEFRYADGRPPVRIGWGITLVLDVSDDATRKAAGRQLLKACEDAPGLHYAAVGVVPAIEPAYLRRGHQLSRANNRYYARFFEPAKALAYWSKPTWIAPALLAGNAIFRPATAARHGQNEAIASFDGAWDRTWDALLRARYELYGKRDADFLNYKLAQPNRTYRAFIHRNAAGTVDGYIVFRRARHITRDLDLVKVCDVVGAELTQRDLLTEVTRFAATDARGTYGIVALSGTADAAAFRSAGLFVARPYPVVVAAAVPGRMRVSFFDSDLDDLW
ncbi:MAG: hypothetical protein WD771_03875 [Gemmatimonadaceae bacterium]